MAKKNKRNSDQDTRGTDEKPPELDVLKCPHLSKAFSFHRLRKAWSSGELGDLTTCKQCEKEQLSREKEVEEVKDDKADSVAVADFPPSSVVMTENETTVTTDAINAPTIGSIMAEEYEDAIWVCLQCANRGCSRFSKHQHAVKHQNASYSDPHDIAINCVTWQVWCYKCDDYLNPQQTENLDQAIKGLQAAKSKQLEGTCKGNESPQGAANRKRNNIKDFRQVRTIKAESNSNFESNTASPPGEESTLLGDVKVNVVRSAIGELQRPKGLQNLGNTCFFNSVMQNLAQTHLLTDACIGATKDGQDGVLWTVQPMGKKSVIREMKTLDLKLNEAGELTSALADFFHHFRVSTNETTFRPGVLFGQICQKSPQFRGFAQQDSHELLRHLFDGVFNEESKRMKRTVLSHFGLKKNVNPDTVKPYLRTQIDAYKKQTHHTFLETVFGGLLINTILCLECRKSSQNFEPFVDLSLPIATPRPVKLATPAQRKPDPIMDELEEKYGGKKQNARNKAKLNSKKTKKTTKLKQKKTDTPSRSREESPAIVENHSGTVPVKEDSAGSAAEDDLDSSATTTSPSKPTEGDLSEAVTVATSKELIRASDSKDEADGEKDKDIDESAGSAGFAAHDEDDDGNREEDSCTKRRHKDNREAENEESLKQEQQDKLENNVAEVDAESILAKVGEIGITQRRRPSDETNGSDSGVDVVCPDGEEDELLREHMDVWKEQSLSTLGNRNLIHRNTSADHSVETCLTAFTDEELLTGKNQFGCDHCTELKGKPNKDGSKQRVHTDAKMQLLILIPPAILTLHLKRFMQDNMRLRKNGVRVAFTKILDLAPYCSKACINLPSIKPEQSSILYSLYGVVQHSGGLHGGHYTAFVKVRPNTGLGSKFLQPLPLKMGLDDLIREMHRRCEKAGQNHSAANESGGPDLRDENSRSENLSPQPSSTLQNGSTTSDIVATQEDTVQEKRKTEICVPEGRWYHISDSLVLEASETSALNAEAYLLFYERLT